VASATDKAGVLGRILEAKRRELALAQKARPLAEVRAQAADAPRARDLGAALRRPDGGGSTMPALPRVIAEIKRRSPSAGELRAQANPIEIAAQYARGGAAALSVLTDRDFFGGSLEDLSAVRAGTRLPVLRKDFLVDPYDVYRARAAGADAVLLIAAALDQAMLVEMAALARELGMGALVEIHGEDEVGAAVAARTGLVGINHRDLRSFEIDLTLTARLRPQLPADDVIVAESGIRVHGDLVALAAAGADAVLVGETLMRAPDPGDALRTLVTGGTL
jgi:indole-3-glycerol phosphate synthase